MFTQNRSFTLDKPFSQILTEMQHAHKQNQHPKPSVTVNSTDETASFSVIQQTNDVDERAILLEAKGSLLVISEDTTHVELSVTLLSSRVMRYLVRMLIVFVIMLIFLVRPRNLPIGPNHILGFGFIMAGFFLFDGIRQISNFRSQMDAFFGDQWQS